MYIKVYNMELIDENDIFYRFSKSCLGIYYSSGTRRNPGPAAKRPD